MGKRPFVKEPKFLVDAYAAELKTRQSNTMQSKEGLKARLALHLALIRYAKQQLKTAKTGEKRILLDNIANNERQVKAIKKYLTKRKSN